MRTPNQTTTTSTPRPPQSPRYSLAAVAVTLTAVLCLAACGGGAPDRTTSSEPSTATSSQPPPAASPEPTTAESPTQPAEPSATPRTKVEATCGDTAPAGVEIKDISLRSTGKVKLNAAVLGTGPRGVVLLHQTDLGVCGWLSYAGYLADHGFHVLIFDRRCTGESGCPSGGNDSRHADDVQTAVNKLRQRGAKKVAVVGASLGGSVAIGSCAVVKAAGCVALSPAIFDSKLGGGLTANRAISTLTTPLLIADAPDDPDSPIADVQALAARAEPGVVQFVELPPGAGHGWDTVDDPADYTRRSAFDATLIKFLDTHLS